MIIQHIKRNCLNIGQIVLLGLLLTGCASANGNEELKAAIEHSNRNLKNATEAYQWNANNPRSIMPDGTVDFVKSRDWTSGFFPGCLWYMFEYTNDSIYLNQAIHYTSLIEEEKFNGKTHDMGFKMYCSFGNGYRLTGNPEYKQSLIQGAQTLVTRFNPKIGCIRSWDHNSDKWQFPVIIDNMMNLELIFWAFKETNDSAYYNIAVSHANRTLENHFRNDFSSFHVVDYDSLTGQVIQKNTHQGYSDNSSWSRGQAWALYGYTLCYRETNDPHYLAQAQNIAEFIFNHQNLPGDLIPYWDYNAPNIPKEPRDASAAAITASALVELSTFSSADQSTKYLLYANKILDVLSSKEYFNYENSANHFLLKHSTGNKPTNSEVDCPIIYADYYYLEVLGRMTNLLQKNPSE